jgi:hypothetical protein
MLVPQATMKRTEMSISARNQKLKAESKKAKRAPAATKQIGRKFFNDMVSDQ